MVSEIRKKINDSELGKRINKSSVGKTFEESPFALTIEAFIDANRNIYKSDPLSGISTISLSPFVFPILWYNMYNHKINDPKDFQEFASYHIHRLKPTYQTV